jgi:hypothetical protein
MIDRFVFTDEVLQPRTRRGTALTQQCGEQNSRR